MSLTAGQFDHLLDAVLEHDATADQVQQLQDHLRRDASAMARYLDMLELHAALAWKNRQSLPPSGVSIQEEQITPTLRRSRSVWYAAAILLLVGATAFLTINADWFTAPPRQKPRPIALVTHLANAVFASSPGEVELGRPLNPGLFELESGSAQFMFDSGAVVDLRGPCAFTMTQHQQGHLQRGLLEAYAPDTAHGFTITAPHGVRVVDLGTRFTMYVDEQGVCDVHVLDGMVMVEVDRPDADKHHIVLTGGQRVQVDPAQSEGDLQVVERSRIEDHIAEADHRIDLQPASPDTFVQSEFDGMMVDDPEARAIEKADLPWTRTFASSLAQGGELTLAIDTEGGANLDLRRREDSRHPHLAHLIEDHVKNQTGGVIVTLTNLAAGTYRVISWHHDAGYGAGGNVFDVRVTDARGASRRVLVGQTVSTGTDRADPTTADFDIVADGENPVTIFYDATSEDEETPLNGLTLTRVEAPGRSGAKQH